MSYLSNNSDDLFQVKQQLALSLTHEKRLQIIDYLESLGKCDIISRLPITLSTTILQQFTPEELVRFRLVCRTWNKKVSHDSIWRQKCIQYNMVPAPATMAYWDSTIPIYRDLFQRCLHMTKNWQTMKCKRIELSYHQGPVLSMVMANPTRLFTGDVNGKIHVWDAQNEIYLCYIQAHTAHVSCLAFCNRYLASGSTDTTIVIHNMKNLDKIATLKGHDGPVTALSFIKNNPYTLFSGSSDRTIRIWDTKTSTCVRILHGQENTIHFLMHCSRFPTTYCQSPIELESVSNNVAGYLVSGSSDRNIFLWDLKTSFVTDQPEVINAVMQLTGPISAMALYDESLTDGTRQNQSRVPDEFTYARQPIHIPPFVAYASINDKTISLCSLPGLENTHVETPNIHRSTIWSISTAIIHSKLVTTSGDRTAIVWDLKSPKTSVTLAGFDSAVISSTISPQEEFLCFGTEKGTIVVFDLMEAA